MSLHRRRAEQEQSACRALRPPRRRAAGLHYLSEHAECGKSLDRAGDHFTVAGSVVGAWLRVAVHPRPAGVAEWLAQAAVAVNTILSQYLMRTIVASTLLVLVVLLALAGLFEFIAELDDTQGGYQTPQVILFAALRLPNLAFEMLPVAALIGSLLGLGALRSQRAYRGCQERGGKYEQTNGDQQRPIAICSCHEQKSNSRSQHTDLDYG